ncbi:MAG: hypothetical protein QOI77_2497 [Blastocatellia bacterium]|jgi:hypothetical protein|nr:hypothetical protein [Blastocatellia bacterium]
MRTTAEIREIESPLSYFFHRSGLLKFTPSLTVGLLAAYSFCILLALT